MSYPRVFISYKREHQASTTLLTELCKALDEYDVLHDEQTRLSSRWDKQLYDWVLGCDAAIVLVSEDAAKSDWCRREWAVLAARWSVAGLTVIPVFVDAKVKTGILDAIQGVFVSSYKGNVIAQVKEHLADVTSATDMTVQDYMAAHQGWIKYQFNAAPVFNREPYALADVYQEPECGKLYWQHIQEDRTDPFIESKKCGGRVGLLESVFDYMGDPGFSELITIQAGPGAGKSAFTLRLANELINQGLHPILVKFRDLRLKINNNVEELLDDAIRIGATDDAFPNPDRDIIHTFLEEAVTFRNADICKSVIILDGWDEVSLTGNESYKAQLGTWLPRIREYFIRKRGAKVRLILTGRPSAEVSHSGVLKNNTPVLTMRPITPEQLTDYATGISKHLSAAKQQDSNSWALDLSSIKPALTHYDKWYHQDSAKTNNSTGDILGNPLLAYLSFIVFSKSSITSKELLEQPTRLYQELVNITVNHAGKAIDEDIEDAAHRGGDKLRRLLHEVAATISLFRVESVSFNELEMRFKDDSLPIPFQLLQDWSKQTDTGSALQELLINFYFKGGNTQLGCEFLHKSFREYLYAEAIFYSLRDSAKQQKERFRPAKNLEYWEDFPEASPEYQLSRRLAYLLSPQWLSNEVRGHLFWLIKQDIGRNTDNWVWLRDAVLTVYAWWAEGVLTRHQPSNYRGQKQWAIPYINQLFEQITPFDDNNSPPIRTIVLDAHLGAALMQLTAFIFANVDTSDNGTEHLGTRELDFVLTHQEELRFNPGGKGFFKALVAKFDMEGWKPSHGLGDMVLDKIALSKQDAGVLTGVRCQLNDLLAQKVHFDGSHFDYSKMNNAILRYCYLFDASLYYTKLENADLSHILAFGTDFGHADLTGADLTGAKLNGANLNGANLTGADLTRAFLTGANLTRANLTNANLTEADLTEADLTGAGLTGANLTKADLTGAIMDDVAGYQPTT